MTSYLSIYLLSCFNSYLFHKDLKFKNAFFYIFFSYIFFFCAFRFNVGGDWKRYLLVYNYDLYHFEDFFFKKESFYHIISYVTHYLTNNIFFNHFIFSAIFFLSILPFLISRRNPALCLSILLPFGIFILHMGFIRQSLALSFIILSIFLYEKKYFYYSFIFIILSIGFHLSAIIFLPVILFHFLNFKIRYLHLLYLILITNLLVFFFITIRLVFNIDLNFEYINVFSNQFQTLKLIQSYIVDNESISLGLFYRIIPTILSFFLFMFYFRNKDINYWLLFFCLLILFIFVCLSLGFYTLADRLNYYTLPFQLIIFSLWIKKFSNNLFNELYFYFLLILNLSLLLIWLLFSNYSKMNWQYYLTIF